MGGWEGDLGGEDFPPPDDDVDMGDVTVWNAQGGGLVGDGGDATVGDAQVGGVVGDAGGDMTVGNTQAGGVVGDAGGDTTVGNTQAGGIVGDAGDMRVDEDHCDPAQGVDNNQETEASGSGSVKMDITPKNSKKPGTQNRLVTRS